MSLLLLFYGVVIGVVLTASPVFLPVKYEWMAMGMVILAMISGGFWAAHIDSQRKCVCEHHRYFR